MSDLWYAIMSVPSKEFKAAEALRERGYTVYVPTRKIAIRSSRYRKGKSERVVPLFPGYLFVYRLIPWNEMNKAHPSWIFERGSDQIERKLLRGALTVANERGEHEARGIPEEIVGKIMLTVKQQEHEFYNRGMVRKLKPGDVALVTSGAWAGNHGTITKVRKSEADIAMKIFGAVRTVRARLQALEAA